MCVWWGVRTHKNIESGFHCLPLHSQELFKNSRLVKGQMVAGNAPVHGCCVAVCWCWLRWNEANFETDLVQAARR